MKKIIACFVALLLISPSFVSADTLSELQAQINALLVQIASLQQQLNQQSGQSTQSTQSVYTNTIGSSNSCTSLTRDLSYRSRDSWTNGEVSTLQDLLQVNGYLNSEPTGYFGLLTLEAVKKFQVANNISPVEGFVGSLTRARLNSMNTCGSTTNIPVQTQTQTQTQAHIGQISYINNVFMKGSREIRQGEVANFYWNIYGNPADSQVSNATIQITNPYNNTVVRTITTNAPNNFSSSPTNNYFAWTVSNDFPVGKYGIKISYTDIVDGVSRVLVSKWASLTESGIEILSKQDTITNFSDDSPVITKTSAKAAENLEMDAGGTAIIYGSNLFSFCCKYDSRVFIGGIEATINSVTKDQLSIQVPSSLTAGQSYDMYVTTYKGTSNNVWVKILSKLEPVVFITYPTNNSSFNSSGPGTVTWTDNGDIKSTFEIWVEVVNAKAYSYGDKVFSTIITRGQAGCGTTNKCSYPLSITTAGTYNLFVKNQTTGSDTAITFKIISPNSSVSTNNPSTTSQTANVLTAMSQILQNILKALSN